MSAMYFHSVSGEAAVRGSERFYAGMLVDKIYIGLTDTKKFLLFDDTGEWMAALNTAIILGNDAVRLLARLHGQCEIHCWVSGPNRKWLAQIIRAGRAEGVLREDAGWESTAEFLEKTDNEPVVCSYSVCSQFPNFDLLPEDHALKQRTDEERYDAYYEIPKHEAFDICFKQLMVRGGGLELTPKTWSSFRFGDGHWAFTPKNGEI